jgi:hypothetical protein
MYWGSVFGSVLTLISTLPHIQQLKGNAKLHIKRLELENGVLFHHLVSGTRTHLRGVVFSVHNSTPRYDTRKSLIKLAYDVETVGTGSHKVYI